ncbi:hypothetical protein AR457_31510 [Streptomyces agglomeratus]|uniref:hypothetical protein n=1 Tax=Streptomyces agglomeratus TaxID=285458 RepID=UPI0008526024|nr:hypothetical protein [Streptomyces agglomeratus]OEJ37612.1 hypothetical protein BGK70_05135 [Streptomyces agglomeratus]OEJ48002.1 hypothetical protein AR457_31510 [Streptomyces agglomeratus]OEJ50151.1 hypothetical protein BGK72_04650 [Streptomyces agglomeratus]OEJ57479.1 hypothetical protein BGM19_05330 [Streptomyces agglomeratus]
MHSRSRTVRWAARSTLSAALVLTLFAPANQAAAAPAPPRIDLRVLVVSDGGPATAAIAAELDGAGTPYTALDLTRPDRPRIDGGFLADTLDGRRRAKYQAVVLPNDNPFGAGSAEMAALVSYEKTFAVPQVDAYTYARPEVGLDHPANGGYSGSLDGVRAEVTAAGAAGPFGYLDGGIPFENNSSSVSESYGYAARPLPGADFTSYVEAPVPGTGQRGSLVGEYRHDGRRELVVGFVYNQYQQQFRLLARGIVDWMTQGVRLGASRNYFAVHVDDVFAADDRWDTELNCTPGDVDCAPGQGGEPDPIRMTAGDAQYAAEWSAARGFTLDMAYNGGGSELYKEEHGGTDPLAQRLTADRNTYRWINHTYNHPFLGCVQDVTVVPWVCAQNPDGSTRYVSRAEISTQIRENRAWGQRAGLPLETGELVTGEHSGLKILPQQPDDNPNLGPALADNGVTWLGSDNSRDRAQRKVGPALTVPRYPMNVFYNAGRTTEQIDEYNWIYTSRADGGSGVCESAPGTTCLDEPLDTVTGYADYIVPLEARIGLGHALANDPRPHFIHQSNLAEDRIAYPVLDRVLDDYAGLYAANTPLVNLRQQQIGAELRDRAAWNTAVKAGQVTAYRIGDTVTVRAPGGVRATATMPAGTRQSLLLGSQTFGSPYAGALSGWVSPALLQDRVTLTLPAGATAGAAAPDRAEPVADSAQRLPVPAGVRKRVPYGVTG